MESPIEELHQDIILYRGFLNEEEQSLWLTTFLSTFQFKDSDGVWNYPDNKGNLKGRCFRRIEDCPSFILEKLPQMKSSIESVAPSLTYPLFTHVLANLYPSEIGMAWHQDDVGQHDGDTDAPVYSLSLGNDAIFLYRERPKGPDHEILLRSGDLLVFGNTMRRMYHSVKRVLLDTYLYGDVRLNLTFRTCSSLTEQEYENTQTEHYNQRRAQSFTKSRKERRLEYNK